MATPLRACTTAVITGKATADGRPLLWKSRDTKGLPRNEVIVYDGAKHRVLAVVNAGHRDEVWMGVNSAGFCIENSLSKDLLVEGETTGPGNGGIMKLALETCASVADFRALLERTNDTGRKTDGNFGVIDAAGGAALFEAGPRTFRMFDANDPEVAPRGYIVRSNFSTTAQQIPAAPDPDSLTVAYSGERYARACRLIERRRENGVTVEYVLQHLCRDMADGRGQPFAGTVNGPAGELPDEVNTSATISRTTTVSAAVFHGVKPGEDPRLTTMWVQLGQDRDGVETDQLRQVWDDVWPVERRLVKVVADMRRRWENAPGSPAEFTELHRHLATQALDAMREELVDMKESALRLPGPPPPVFAPSDPAPTLIP